MLGERRIRRRPPKELARGVLGCDQTPAEHYYYRDGHIVRMTTTEAARLGLQRALVQGHPDIANRFPGAGKNLVETQPKRDRED